jgi:hypothetical protein
MPKNAPTNGRSRERAPRSESHDRHPPFRNNRLWTLVLRIRWLRFAAGIAACDLPYRSYFISLPGLPLCADVCDPAALVGAYGFQLSGETTISGESKPVSNIGRMVLAADGAISGYSTAMFAGFLLGNPVTGIYEARWDCTISWSLQDDSGAFQHFDGVATSDGKTVHFRQADPGGAQHGIMARTPAECKPSDLRTQYAFTLSGASIPMLPGPASNTASNTIDAKGLIKADANASFKLALEGASALTRPTLPSQSMPSASSKSNSRFPLKTPSAITPVKLRGILIHEGREILAIETDPGAMVTAAFTAP